MHAFANALLLLSLLLSLSGTCSSVREETAPKPPPRVVHTRELTHANVSQALKDWDTDLAILFYAPWCKYCKQLVPSWEQIATLMTGTKDVVVGKFNCEQPAANNDICVELGVDRYPSLFYIGYGKLNQAPAKGWVFGKNEYPRIARFNADLYPEAIYDWLQMLSKISGMQRWFDDLKGFFTGKSRIAMKYQKLQDKYHKQERTIELYSEALEKYKADELFDSLTDHGDPFKLLANIELSDTTLPFRVCIGEMAAEYCKFHDEDVYCRNFTAECLDYNMEPEECRPALCPFSSSKGCKVVSACMQSDVLEQYKEALFPTKKAATATAAKR